MKKEIFAGFVFMLSLTLFTSVALAKSKAPVNSTQSSSSKKQSAEEKRLTAIKNAQKQNKEVMGWIYVPGTNINYPVLLGEDNNYYLTHNHKKEVSKSGAIFMDCRNADKSQQRHIILWGHNLNDMTMFQGLENYKNKNFFESHPNVYLYWGEEKVQYEVYAAYGVDGNINFHRTEFDSDKNFLQHMNELRTLNKYKPTKEITLKADDQILSLATCAYEYPNSYYIVQARRVGTAKDK